MQDADAVDGGFQYVKDTNVYVPSKAETVQKRRPRRARISKAPTPLYCEQYTQLYMDGLKKMPLDRPKMPTVVNIPRDEAELNMSLDGYRAHSGVYSRLDGPSTNIYNGGNASSRMLDVVLESSYTVPETSYYRDSKKSTVDGLRAARIQTMESILPLNRQPRPQIFHRVNDHLPYFDQDPQLEGNVSRFLISDEVINSLSADSTRYIDVQYPNINLDSQAVNDMIRDERPTRSVNTEMQSQYTEVIRNEPSERYFEERELIPVTSRDQSNYTEVIRIEPCNDLEERITTSVDSRLRVDPSDAVESRADVRIADRISFPIDVGANIFTEEVQWNADVKKRDEMHVSAFGGVQALEENISWTPDVKRSEQINVSSSARGNVYNEEIEWNADVKQRSAPEIAAHTRRETGILVNAACGVEGNTAVRQIDRPSLSVAIPLSILTEIPTTVLFLPLDEDNFFIHRSTHSVSTPNNGVPLQYHGGVLDPRPQKRDINVSITAERSLDVQSVVTPQPEAAFYREKRSPQSVVHAGTLTSWVDEEPTKVDDIRVLDVPGKQRLRDDNNSTVPSIINSRGQVIFC